MRTTLAVLLPLLLAAQGALLQIQVVSGEGAVHPGGSRGLPGLVVLVTDELGRAQAGVPVSFRLPDDGAGGAFLSGLATEIVSTGADGRATAPAVRWNRIPGALEIRVTAARDGRRAGITVLQHIADRPAPVRPGGFGISRKWLYIAAIAAGAAGLGLTRGRAGGSASAAASTAGGAQPEVEIGAPTVTIGKP